MKFSRRGLFFFSCVAALAALGCGHAPPSAPDAALNSFSGDRMLAHIRVLSSDEFEGRGPGSKGEQLTIQYLQDQFRRSGLKPGNPDGTYLQNVPLVGITADPSMRLTFAMHTSGRWNDGGSAQERILAPVFGNDFVAWTKRVSDGASIDADVIFVGYGVQAPEFQWDDFKGTDVRGKVIVALVNDPPVADPDNPAQLDPNVFGGNAMTYYGRWTYKFEKAAELGAAGCFIIHQTERAGYPWEVVRDSWSAEQFDLLSPDKNKGRVAIEGWLSQDTATTLFRMAGLDLQTLTASAARRSFHPVDLHVRANLAVHNRLRTIESHNVIARLAGSDPKLKDTYVVYTAHWDHFGIGPEVNGDRIYHGAVDNASGTAALLEIARAYKQLRTPPRRSIVFLAVTAEEQGLLGSEYYAKHALYPLDRTAVDINMDGMNVNGRTTDVAMIGKGNSTLDEVVMEAAKSQGRVVKPDPEPEKGFFYRSDHFSFAKEGVPVFDPNSGVDYIGKPAGWGLEVRRKYSQENYHKPSDKVHDDWDMSGAVQDGQLYFLVGYRIANSDVLPAWKSGNEFKAKRDAMLRAAGAHPE